MRRYDRLRVIEEQNKKLNAKKSSIQENYMPGDGSTGEYYDFILQGEFYNDEDAMEHAQGQDWASKELTSQRLTNLDYIDTVNGIEIYKNYGADYYAFKPAEGDMGENDLPGDDSFPDEFKGMYDDHIEPEEDMGPDRTDLGSWIEHQNHQEHEEAIRKERERFRRPGLGESKKRKNLKLINEVSQTMFEKLCGINVIKENVEGPEAMAAINALAQGISSGEAKYFDHNRQGGSRSWNRHHYWLSNVEVEFEGKTYSIEISIGNFSGRYDEDPDFDVEVKELYCFNLEDTETLFHVTDEPVLRVLSEPLKNFIVSHQHLMDVVLEDAEYERKNSDF